MKVSECVRDAIELRFSTGPLGCDDVARIIFGVQDLHTVTHLPGRFFSRDAVVAAAPPAGAQDYVVVDTGGGYRADRLLRRLRFQDYLPRRGPGVLRPGRPARRRSAAVRGPWRRHGEPDAKELQSIIDYSRSPDTSGSAAIDLIFNATSIVNEKGVTDYPFYWTGTTHANAFNGRNAVYVAFGRALGYMNGQWLDVHGAGAQRSDPKFGDPADWPQGNGPQGDAIRIDNYVRLVRTVDVDRPTAPVAAFTHSPSAPLVGQTVQFTDRTTGDPTSRSWDFGDGLSSSRTSPSHVFTAPGTYTVTLTVSNAQGSDTIRQDLTVREAGVCAAGSTTLCLNDDRFRVEVAWVDFAGSTGSGQFGSEGDTSAFYAP